MKSLAAIFIMLRPINLLLGSLSVLITAALMPSWPPWNLIGLAAATVVALNAAANALNDYFDFSIDLINRPSRPLVSGALPRQAVRQDG
jgi:geranylgeranylglycerol-phosphate geranylgeranyltransferase